MRMNKVFEKILERLGKLHERYVNQYGVVGGNPMAFAVKECKDIVHEVAEEFATDTNVGTNGWIPCSERLPENGGYYLVTYHEWSKGNFLPKYNDTYVRKMHYQKSERFTGWNYPLCVDDRAENDTNREVIAWQPLPEVYKN